MSIQLIILAAVVISEIILGFTALIKNPKSKANRSFAIMTWCMSIWGVSLYLFHQPNSNALFWGKIVFAITYLTGFSLLSFAVHFPASVDILPKTAKLFLSFSKIYLPIVLILCLISIFTPWIMTGVEFFDWGNNFTTGPLYPTFIFHMIFMAISSFAIMIAKYRKLIGIEKLQLKYLFLGLSIAGTATLFMNMIWPLLSGINNLSKYGPLSMILLIALTAYAITRYRLMDIRIILRRVFVHILVTVSFLTVILG
ncbi:MAG: histidine kinase N-terminal 7TM domain-containing protein, partial [bacterium]|nr:histidine kinase N-terminal 7TM domain-containing protein [bacterium]